METISQRQLRNNSGEILRRAAAGEVFRIRTGDTTVELRRSTPDVIERLTAAGLLSAGSTGGDLPELPPPVVGGEALEATMDAIRGDR